MKKYSKTSKILICAVLSVSMLLSLTSCGKKSAQEIDEYGGEDASTLISEEATEDQSLVEELVEPSEEAGVQISPNGEISWSEALTVKGNVIDVNAFVEVPELNSLNVYKSNINLDDTNGEEEFVNKIFDSDAEKLESISYTNETDYIMQLYKYDRIQDMQSEYGFDYDMIDKSFDQKYEWINTQSMSIHMYQGKFQGIDYVLLLGYDHMNNEKYINFMPKNINDYFPEHRFQTMMAKRSVLADGTKDDFDNKCLLSEEEVTSRAQEFLEGRVGLNGIDSKVGLDATDYAQEMSDMNLGMEDENQEFCLSSLVFSESDLLSTYATITEYQSYRHNMMLAEQEDKVKEYMDEHKMDDRMMATFDAALEADPAPEDKLYEDGYAVYLDDIYNINAGHPTKGSVTNGVSWGFSSAIGNKGAVMLTQEGIFGIDLKLKYETVDVTEDVELLEFDKIRESVINTLNKEVNFEELGTENLTLPGMSLCYSEVGEGSEVTLIPTWKFVVFSDKATALIKINAIDGSLHSCDIFSNLD
ncbi:MAG: hypothetical protein J5517_10535 [Eubacterium sp.]|nr:hypothetical protein [Eubacterium sp.]